MLSVLGAIRKTGVSTGLKSGILTVGKFWRIGYNKLTTISPTESELTLLINPIIECAGAAQVAAVCRLPETHQVREQLSAAVDQPSRADLLWLTWIQWRALGREAMIRETGLSLWTITSRLRQLREAGAPVLSWTEERELIARGRFHQSWQ